MSNSSTNLATIVATLIGLLLGPYRFQFARRYRLESAAQGLEKWQTRLEQTSRWLVVVIVGEFNAGKSTLVNSLYLRRVAFTDPFEATQTATMFVPDSVEYALVEFDDGRVEGWDLSVYMKAAEQRQLARVVRSHVHLQHAFPFIVIDTPGLATIEQSHVERAEEAIREADVIVWVMDPNDLMSAKEGAFIRRAREIGIPIVPVLSKVDSLTEEEFARAVSYVPSRLGFAKDDLIAVAAELHTREQPDCGIVQLTNLLTKLAESMPHTRQRAQVAKHREVIEEATRVAVTLQEKLVADLRWLEAERELIATKEQALQKQMQRFGAEEVSRAVVNLLAVRLPETISQEQLNSACQTAVEGFESLRLDLAKRLQETAKQQATQSFDLQFADRIHALENQIEKLSDSKEDQQSNIDYLRQQLEEELSRRQAVRTAIPHATDATTDIWKVVINAAVGTVSLLIANPWPLVVTGLGSILIPSGRKNSEKVELLTREKVAASLAEGIASHCLEQFVEPIKRYLAAIADEALCQMCKKRCDGRVPRDLDEARDKLDQVETDLKALCR